MYFHTVMHRSKWRCNIPPPGIYRAFDFLVLDFAMIKPTTPSQKNEVLMPYIPQLIISSVQIRHCEFNLKVKILVLTFNFPSPFWAN
jgi:hypothetical protein